MKMKLESILMKYGEKFIDYNDCSVILNIPNKNYNDKSVKDRIFQEPNINMWISFDEDKVHIQDRLPEWTELNPRMLMELSDLFIQNGYSF